MSEENNIIEQEVKPEVKEKEDTDKNKKVENKALTTTKQKLKKHLEAKKLVDEAKSIAAVSQSELSECIEQLDTDIRKYEDAKKAFNEGVLSDAKALLYELGHTKESNESTEESVTVSIPTKDAKPIVLKDVHSGRFTGLILSFFGGIITFIGLIYLATEKLNMTLYVDKIPDNDTIHDIFAWFGTLFGRSDDAMNGGLFVVVVVLSVMALIYLLRVSLKGASNLRFATKQMKETQKYITYNSNCKVEMERMDAHILDAINVLKDYDVVLQEQNAKLARIRHFEGKQSSLTGYHDKSVQEMNSTQNLIENISQFMSASISEDEKLSSNSTLFLHSAKESMQKILSKFS